VFKQIQVFHPDRDMQYMYVSGYFLRIRKIFIFYPEQAMFGMYVLGYFWKKSKFKFTISNGICNMDVLGYFLEYETIPDFISQNGYAIHVQKQDRCPK
jgi:hypothetical protein